MKKKTKELEYYFNPLVLYLNDLEKIEEFFKEAGCNVKIETENFVLGNIKELKEQLVDNVFNGWTVSQCVS